MAGIEIDELKPGYKNIKLQPIPGGNLGFVRASLETPYGRVRSEWEIRDGRIEYLVTIPPNTTADLILPRAGQKPVTENGRALGSSEIRPAGEHATLSRGSGEYRFSWSWN
jgi:alpha-L-rhamnosidase